MKYQRILANILFVIIGIILFNLATANYLETEKLIERMEIGEATMLQVTRIIYGLLIGLLIKWPIILECFKGQRGLNGKFVAGLIFLVIAFIPPIVIAKTIGVPSFPFPETLNPLYMISAPLYYNIVQFPLSIVSGIMIAEGLHSEPS